MRAPVLAWLLPLLLARAGAFSPRAAIAFPAYNEALRLPKQDFISFAETAKEKGIRLIFVNDGSTDGTAALLRDLKDNIDAKLGGDESVVQILTLAENAGKAEAIRQGMLAGISQGAGAVGFWDSDLATPLYHIEDFLRVLDGSSSPGAPQREMVFGARVNLLGRRIQRKASRHYLGRVFATLASIVLDLGIYDTQCGAKVFRVTDDLRYLLKSPFQSRWVFDVELIARFASLRRCSTAPDLPSVEESIFEYPLEEWRDVAGSKVAFLNQVIALYDLSHVFIKYFSPFASWPTGDGRTPLPQCTTAAARRCRIRDRGILNVVGAIAATVVVATGAVVYWIFSGGQLHAVDVGKVKTA